MQKFLKRISSEKIDKIDMIFLAFMNFALNAAIQFFVFIKFGSNGDTDAYVASTTVPYVLLSILGSAASFVSIPELAGISEKDERKADCWIYAIIFLMLALLISLAGIFFAESIAKILFNGFSHSQTSSVAFLMRIQLISISLGVAAIVIKGWMQVEGRLKQAEIIIVLSNTLGLCYLILELERIGINAAAYAILLKFSLQLIIFIAIIRLPSRMDLIFKKGTKALKNSKHMLMSGAYLQTETLFDRLLISYSASGVMSNYYLSNQILGAASTVISNSIIPKVLPNLSLAAKSKDKNSYWKIFNDYRKETLLFAMISLGAIYIFSWTWYFLFGSFNHFEKNDILQINLILLLLGGSFVFGLIGNITVRAYYSLGDMKTPAKISYLTYLGYIPLKFLAYIFFGVWGIAGLTSIYVGTNLYIQFAMLRKYEEE